MLSVRIFLKYTFFFFFLFKIFITNFILMYPYLYFVYKMEITCH
jgi:hypothetical protein